MLKGIEERGRHRVTWMKNKKEWLGHNYNGCVKSGRSEQLEIMIADLLLVDGTSR